MKIKYLGTAAAEGVPAIGCNCEVCQKSRLLKGRNIRSRSQALINDDLLIDFNADTFWHTNNYDINLNKIHHTIITHAHEDHFYLDEMMNFRPDFCHGYTTMNVYATTNAYNQLVNLSNRDYMKDSLKAHLVTPFERFKVLDYEILPLVANHDPSSNPVIYAIFKDNKKLLYAHDTGVFFEETMEALKGIGPFDLVSLDCTGCLGLKWDWINGHMSLKTNVIMIEKLKEIGCINDSTILVCNHFSHNGGQCYDDMLEEAKKHNIIVSYDGLEIEF